MPVFTALFAGTALVMTFVAYCGWAFVKLMQKKPTKGLSPRSQRRDEEANLTTEQHKLYLRAQKLLADNNIRDAARILESIGMVRRSVSVLEKNGFTDIAAEILLRIDRPHRAGVIYARANKWEHAMHCFKMAKMPVEVAKCLHEMGRFKEAGRLFEKSRDYINAAMTYQKCHRIRDVAQCLYFAGQNIEAYIYLKQHLKENLHLHNINLTKLELQLIDKNLQDGNHSPEVIHALVVENYLGDVIYKLITLGRLASAVDLYKSADSKAIASLIGKITLGNVHSESLMELFRLSKDHISLAMAHEKIGQYEQAAKTYELANNLIQAMSCYSQSNDEEGVQRISQLLAERKKEQEAHVAKNAGDKKTKILNMDIKSEVNNQELTQTKRQRLEDCSLFDELNSEQKKRFWMLGQTLKFKENQEILTQEAIPKGIYIIILGSVLSIGKDENALIIDEGNSFGEQDILLNKATGNYYVAKTDCLIHLVNSSELRNLMDKDGQLTRTLFQNTIKNSQSHFEVERVSVKLLRAIS